MSTVQSRLGVYTTAQLPTTLNTVAGSATAVMYNCNRYTSTGGHTLTLPAIASADIGASLEVRHAGSGVLTLDGDGADTIEGAATQTLYALESVVLRVMTATAWEVI